MSDKYYTPKIEEFHVGFEYEVHLSSSQAFIMDFSIEKADSIPITEKHENWTEMTFTGNEFDTFNLSFAFVPILEDKRIRVKYLDEEDINDKGFIKRSKDEWIGWNDYILDAISGEIPYFLKATIHKSKMDDVYKIYLHRYLDDDTKIESQINEGESELIYKGKIRNKSELHKIMQQLGII